MIIEFSNKSKNISDPKYKHQFQDGILPNKISTKTEAYNNL